MMKQSDSRSNAYGVPFVQISIRMTRAFLGGASAFALWAPLASLEASAQGWQVTRQYYPGGSTTTYREFGPGNDSISALKGPAPGNDCPVLAFEVMNPGHSEARCVGYVAPSWLPKVRRRQAAAD